MASINEKIKSVCWSIIRYVPGFRIMYYTRGTQNPITLSFMFWQKILGFNRSAYWPMHFTSIANNPVNIYAGIDVCPGYSPGCYIQAIGKVYIDDYTQIAPNVGIISANHDLYDSRKHILKDVRIGKYCWIGMNSVILPGVVLGDFTIVAAGSIVTKSFEEGSCIIGGNPARVIKKLEENRCIRFHNKFEYNGYIKSSKFSDFRRKYLNV